MTTSHSAARSANVTSSLDAAAEVRWAPRVPPHLIRRLYERDAMGIVDDELIDEVGYALLARCESILAATEAHYGRIRCPRCAAVAERQGRVTEKTQVIQCDACGWATTWGAYHKTYRGKKLFGANAVSAFRAFVEEFARASTPQRKMVAIDQLIHAFHGSLAGTLGRPAAANLIEANLRDSVAFLDRLTYGPATTPGLRESHAAWEQTRAAAAHRYDFWRTDRDDEAQNKVAAGVTPGAGRP
jgi:phage FluMu protein Com